jgi:hypothetical protein
MVPFGFFKNTSTRITSAFQVQVLLFHLWNRKPTDSLAN